MLEYISHSSSSTFRRCPYRFQQLYYGEGTPIQPKLGQQLGSAGHAFLAALYSGKNLSDAIDFAYEEFNPSSPDELEKFTQFQPALKTYYKTFLIDHWNPVVVEYEIKLNRYMGIIDLIAQIGSQYYIVDHKFQKSTSTSHVSFDAQLSFYLMLARNSRLTVPITGAMLNIISKDSGKPIRKITYRSTEFLDKFQRDLDKQIELMDKLSYEPGYRNFTHDCSWDCPIFTVCVKEMEAK